MILRPLFAHQKAALAYAMSRRTIALFMEMRLGKTLVAIRWARSIPGPKLVVAPLTTLASWADELHAEGIPQNGLTFLREIRAKALPHPFEQARWCLTNYEQLRAKPEWLVAPWKVLILDESTRIRNPKAQITRLLVQSTRHIPQKAILSGLPAPESPLDYCEQLRFLDGHFMTFPNYWTARYRLFRRGLTAWDWVPNPCTIGLVKTYVHARAFVRTRHQVGMGSRKLYERRTVSMTPLQRTAYQQVERNFAKTLTTPQGTLTQTTKWEVVKLLWMARIAGGYDNPEEARLTYSTKKCDEVLALLEGELLQEAVVVWFRFNEELAQVSDALSHAGIPHRRITGETPTDHRQAFVRDFRSQKVRVLLCQVKCAKFGVDLSVASTAIYYSNSYDYEDRAQSEDRIVHPTKKTPLLYIDLVTEGTVDEDVVAVLRDKHVSARTFMTSLVAHWHQRQQEGLR